MPPPQMTILNAPSREECIARRERTNTPLQALLLLNEVEYLKAARHLAQQTLKTGTDSASQRVELIYETITSQLPTEQQRDALIELSQDLESLYAEESDLAEAICGGEAPPAGTTKSQWAAWTLVASTVYNLDITKTRQ